LGVQAWVTPHCAGVNVDGVITEDEFVKFLTTVESEGTETRRVRDELQWKLTAWRTLWRGSFWAATFYMLGGLFFLITAVRHRRLTHPALAGVLHNTSCVARARVEGNKINRKWGWQDDLGLAGTVFYLCGGILFYQLDLRIMNTEIEARQSRFLAFRDQVLRCKKWADPGDENCLFSLGATWKTALEGTREGLSQ